MTTKPIPEGYHTITAQLAIPNAQAAIDFYKKALGAEVVDQAIDPSGKKIWHAALRIGTSMLFVNDVFEDMGGSPAQSQMWLYVEDCDASFKRAVDAGAKATMPPTDMFWGDRFAGVVDPFGQKWSFATRTKDMTPAEQETAQAEFIAQMAKK